MVYQIVYSLVDLEADQLIPTISARGHNMRFMVPFAKDTCLYYNGVCTITEEDMAVFMKTAGQNLHIFNLSCKKFQSV